MKIQLSDTDLRDIARIKMLEKKCKKFKNTDLREIARIKMLEKKCKKFKCRRTSYRIAGIASKLLSSKKTSKRVKAIAGAALSLRGNC